jgi:hypothetical protein
VSIHNVQAEIARSALSGTVQTTPIHLDVEFDALTAVNATSRWLFVNTTLSTMQVTDIREIHTVPAAAAAVMSIYKAPAAVTTVTGGTLLHGASDLLLNSTADTTVTATLSTTLSTVQIAPGGKLGWAISAQATTALVGGCLSIEMIPVA